MNLKEEKKGKILYSPRIQIPPIHEGSILSSYPNDDERM
jgi:hypothetical protein